MAEELRLKSYGAALSETRMEEFNAGYALLRTVAPQGLLDMGECREAGLTGGLDFLQGKSPHVTPCEVMYAHEHRKGKELWARIDPGDARFLKK